jgi:D-alanyl-D-alanine carboxypeptidase
VSPMPSSPAVTGPSGTPDVPAPSQGAESTPITGGDLPRWTPRPVAPPVGLRLTPRLDRALQRSIDAARVGAGIPGISVTIIFPDGATWTGVSGLADVGRGIPVTEETAFAIASVTKTFTAALVLGLAADGRIDLDGSAASYLPELELDPAITIRHLLDHTSGLRDYFGQEMDPVLLAEPAVTWAPQRALEYVGTPHFAPGRGWQYSNTNYLLLGLLAERVTGEDLAVLYRTRLFEPAGLRHAFTQGSEAPRGPLARGYRFAGGSPALDPIELSDGTAIVPFTSVVTASAGAGRIAATSVDVARWAWALYRDDVLGPGTVARILADAQVVARLRPRIPYGLGTQAIRLDRGLTLGHSGRFLGFRAAVRYLPEHEVAIALLTNQSRTEVGGIVYDLLRILLPGPGRCGLCAVAD